MDYCYSKTLEFQRIYIWRNLPESYKFTLAIACSTRLWRTSYAPFGSFTFTNPKTNKTNESNDRPKRHLKTSIIENNIRNSLPETLAMGSKTTFTSKTFQSSSESFHTETVNTEKSEEKVSSSSSQYFGHLDCGPTQCTYIACTVGPLKKKEYVVFRVRSRLWTTTVAKVTIIFLHSLRLHQ